MNTSQTPTEPRKLEADAALTQKTVAWAVQASNRPYGTVSLILTDREEMENHNPKYIRPLIYGDASQPAASVASTLDAPVSEISDLLHSIKVDSYTSEQVKFLQSIADRLAALHLTGEQA